MHHHVALCPSNCKSTYCVAVVNLLGWYRSSIAGMCDSLTVSAPYRRGVVPVDIKELIKHALEKRFVCTVSEAGIINT